MWPNPQFPADLVTFAEEILNEKLHISCGVNMIGDSDSKAAVRSCSSN